MSIDLPSPFRPSSEFYPIKDNAQAARQEECCDEVMNVALVVFSVMTAIAFISCFTAALVLSSAALGTAAGVIALVAFTVLAPSALIVRPSHTGYTEVLNAEQFTGYPGQYQPPYCPQNVSRRHAVPQASPHKPYHQTPVYVGSHGQLNRGTTTIHGHVVPGQDQHRR